MKGLERFAVYQLKNTPETRAIRFCSYQALLEKGIQTWHGNYENVYVGIMLRGDTPETIRERFNRKLPKAFKGHSISTSDVLVLTVEDVAAVYYVDVDGFIVLDGFFRNGSSGPQLSLSVGDRNVRIQGKEGTWHVFDSIFIEKNRFFLMEHERYGKEAAWVVADEHGKLVADGIREGFDQSVRKQIEDYVAQNQRTKEGKVSASKVKAGKNVLKKATQGRASVLAKLREKQKRIAERREKSAGRTD